MQKFASGHMGLSTGFGKASISNVELAGLVAEFYSFYAYAVFTNRCFSVTPRVALFGVCRNEAAELAIDVEVNVFRGIVEEANDWLWGPPSYGEGTADQPDNQQQAPFHADQLPSAVGF